MPVKVSKDAVKNFLFGFARKNENLIKNRELRGEFKAEGDLDLGGREDVDVEIELDL